MIWSPSRAVSWRRFDWGLAAILAIAAVARLTGISFGLPHPFCRPDETTIGSIASRFYHGQFNPLFFNYPALFMLVVAGCLFLWLRLGWLLGYLRSPGAMDAFVTTTPVHLIARLLSATAGIATVWVVYRIALRLFDRTTALVAALFLALTFLHVRDSHFGVTDVAATFAAALAFLLVLRLEQSGRTADLVVAAVVAGLAVSTKYNVALIAAPALLVILADSRRTISARMGRACAFALVMGTAFVATSPYSVIAWSEFIDAVRSESEHLRTGHGRMMGRGWVVHLTSTLRYGMGLPMLVASIAGIVWLTLRRPGPAAILCSFPVLYFVVVGSGYTLFVRYMMPIVPFLCITAALATTEAARWAARWTGRPQVTTPAVAVLAVLVALPSARSVIAFDRLIARSDNRLVAANWIERRFPNGVTIAEYGPEFGHVFVAAGSPERAALYPIVPFDGSGVRPDIIVVQSSPLNDDEPPPDAAASVIAREYRLGAAFEVAGEDPESVYDWPDEFYLPLTGFTRITRPGPNLRIYVRDGP